MALIGHALALIGRAQKPRLILAQKASLSLSSISCQPASFETGSKGNIDPVTNILLSFFSYLATHTLCAMYTARRGGEGRNSLTRCARFRLCGPRSFAPAPGAPVSQASGLLLVLLDQDYQANTPPMCARTYNIRELGNEQGLVWQEVYWKIGTSLLISWKVVVLKTVQAE